MQKNTGTGYILAPGHDTHGKQETTKVVPIRPNRAVRRARAQNMQRMMKHINRAFVLTCSVCHKPFIAPVAQKCSCPVARPLDQSRSK